MNISSFIQNYLPSKENFTWLADEAVKVGFEAVKQATPYVPALRTFTGTLTMAGMVANVYQIGPKRIASYLLGQEGEDKLTAREITAVKAVGATALIWTICNATELFMHYNWNPQKREFTQQDYLDEAKHNLDRWIRPKMTLSDPLAPFCSESFTEKCIEKMTHETDGKIIADLKWDPDCWNNFQAPHIHNHYSYSAAKNYGSITWGNVPVERHFRYVRDDPSYTSPIRGNNPEFYIPRFLNPSWEDIPTTESDGISVYLRKPEECSMQLPREPSIGRYELFRDVINQHGGPFDHCDLTDKAAWPDDSWYVKNYYSTSCNDLTREHPGAPARSVPECDHLFKKSNL